MSPRPNITQAQVASIVSALVAVLAVVYQAPARLQVPLIIVVGACAVAWLVSDAFLRGKRNEHAAAQVNQATAQILAMPAEGDDSIVPAAAPAPRPAVPQA